MLPTLCYLLILVAFGVLESEAVASLQDQQFKYISRHVVRCFKELKTSEGEDSHDEERFSAILGDYLCKLKDHPFLNFLLGSSGYYSAKSVNFRKKTRLNVQLKREAQDFDECMFNSLGETIYDFFMQIEDGSNLDKRNSDDVVSEEVCKDKTEKVNFARIKKILKTCHRRREAKRMKKDKEYVKWSVCRIDKDSRKATDLTDKTCTGLIKATTETLDKCLNGLVKPPDSTAIPDPKTAATTPKDTPDPKPKTSTPGDPVSESQGAKPAEVKDTSTTASGDDNKPMPGAYPPSPTTESATLPKPDSDVSKPEDKEKAKSKPAMIIARYKSPTNEIFAQEALRLFLSNGMNAPISIQDVVDDKLANVRTEFRNCLVEGMKLVEGLKPVDGYAMVLKYGWMIENVYAGKGGSDRRKGVMEKAIKAACKDIKIQAWLGGDYNPKGQDLPSFSFARLAHLYYLLDAAEIENKKENVNPPAGDN